MEIFGLGFLVDCMDKEPIIGQIGGLPPICVRKKINNYAKTASLSFLSAATFIMKFLAA